MNQHSLEGFMKVQGIPVHLHLHVLFWLQVGGMADTATDMTHAYCSAARARHYAYW